VTAIPPVRAGPHGQSRPVNTPRGAAQPGEASPNRLVAREKLSGVMGTAKTSTSALNMRQHGTCQKLFQA